jgi:hypothetical protein
VNSRPSSGPSLSSFSFSVMSWILCDCMPSVAYHCCCSCLGRENVVVYVFVWP